MTLGSCTTFSETCFELVPMLAVTGTVTVGPVVVVTGKVALVRPAATLTAPGTETLGSVLTSVTG